MILCMITSQAQVEQGRFTLGGGFSGSISKSTITYGDDEQKIKSLGTGVNPAFGYFLIDGLVVGGSTGVNYTKQETFISSSNFSSRTIVYDNFDRSTGVFVTYYIGNKSTGRPFVGVSTNQNWSRYSYTTTYEDDLILDATRKGTRRYMSAVVNGGYGWFLNDNFILGMFASLNVNLDNQKTTYDQSTETIDVFSKFFNIGVSISSTFKKREKAN